ncbi:MAG: transcriptional regulator [Chloroflexi bacterium]|nr:MAG: transcriptional regulator [Chloroflexota bacterium]
MVQQKEQFMDPERKQQILNRLKTIEGHIRGVQRMVEEDAYCIDLLNQTRAIQQALAKLDAIILTNHLHSCVTTAIRSEDVGERERVLTELLQVFESTHR